MATEAMNESWRRILSQIQSVWTEIEFTDAELKKARGNLKVMVSLIHEHTGEPKAEILQKITSFL